MLNHEVLQPGEESKAETSVKEYYEVLGLKEGATLEEVTARYLALKKYIISSIERGLKPEKTLGQINEAYMKLKESKLPVAVNFDLEEHLRRSFTSVREERRRARRKKIIISTGILAAFLIVSISLLVLERTKAPLPPGAPSAEAPNLKIKGSLEKASSFVPESKAPEKVAKAVPKEPSKLTLPESAKPAAKLPPQPSSAPPAVSIPKAPPPALKPAPPVEVAKAIPREPPKPVIAEKPKPAAEAVKRVEPPKPVPQEPAPTPAKAPQEVRAKVEAPVVTPVVPPPPKPAPPVEVAKVAPQEARSIAKPDSAKVPETRKEKESVVASIAPSAIASDQEVRNFFDNYLVRYNRKEPRGFISLFSARAIQNQKDDVETIRKTYENFFAQMESVNYQIAITGIEPRQDQVEVKAQYELEGIVAKGRKMQTWKGQIRWVLVREGGALKILSLDYQPSK